MAKGDVVLDLCKVSVGRHCFADRLSQEDLFRQGCHRPPPGAKKLFPGELLGEIDQGYETNIDMARAILPGQAAAKVQGQQVSGDNDKDRRKRIRLNVRQSGAAGIL